MALHFTYTCCPASLQALNELKEEGSIAAKHARYNKNRRILVNGIHGVDFATLLSDDMQASILASFLHPNKNFEFKLFY